MKISKSTKILGCLTCLILLSSAGMLEAKANPITISTPIEIAQTTSQSIPQQVLSSTISKLKAKTRVPLKLPTQIPQEEYPLYVTVNTATSDQYELTIGTDKDCSGGNYCRYGTIAGQRVTATTPSVEEAYAFLNDPNYQPSVRSKEKMGKVALANGVEGYFIPYVCGASCDDSKVIWEQNGYRYLVGVKSGDKKTIVDMANSAISSRAASPVDAPSR